MKEEVADRDIKSETTNPVNEHIVKIISISQVTHNVKQFRLQKPEGYHFVPGQATEVSINSPQWKEERRPFTFTCLADDPFLEFTIKIYKDHGGMTNALGSLQAGDELIVHDVWGAISYKGPGYFIAGGAGITPFIAILRELKRRNQIRENKLFFSNRTSADIIIKDELEQMLGPNAVFITTQEPGGPYNGSKINERFLKDHIQDFSAHFYICGPDQMIADISSILTRLGASPDAVIFEK